MASIDITATSSINCPSPVVRQQFGDVAHHQAQKVHRGVDFEVVEENSDACRYRQVTQLGPVKLTQVIELTRSPTGPLVNRVLEGQFAGGTISFTISPDPNHQDVSIVEATVNAEVKGIQALVAPLVRSNVRKALQRALNEDKELLESGAYSPAA